VVEYLDSGSGDPNKAVGRWLEDNLLPGIRAMRLQTGYFSMGSLRNHLETLRDVEVIRLILGSNAPEQPTAEDVRQLVSLIAGRDSRSLTIVQFRGSILFHPKTIHLLREDGTAVAYVGSANMTKQGLGWNAEAGVVIGPGSGGALDDIAAATDAWAGRNEEGVFRVRTAEDVDDLLARGVLQTADQRGAARAAIRRVGRTHGGRGGLRRTRLWSPATTPPAQGGGTPAEAEGREAGRGTSPGPGEVLLMRVRKRRGNGNQIQISKVVLRGPFMNGATEVILPDGSRRRIGGDVTRGGVNTERFEAPGLKDMTNPVARLQWVDPGGSGRTADRLLRLDLFDAERGGVGAEIFRKLEEGIATSPVTNLRRLGREQTVLSKRNRERAQWYRLDSA
jgi:hypothetical protein